MYQRVYADQADRPLPVGSLHDSGFRDVLSLINRSPQAAQVNTLTTANWAAGVQYAYTIAGIARTYTATAADANNNGVAASITALINNDPIHSPLLRATVVNNVITLTARRAGFGYTVTADGVNLVAQQTTANAAAATVAFGRLVVDDGQSTADFDGCGKLASAANLTARQVDLAPVAAVDGVQYHVDVTIGGITYHAVYDGADSAADDFVTQNAAPGQLTWRCNLAGEIANNVSVEMYASAERQADTITTGAGATEIVWTCLLLGTIANSVTLTLRDPGGQNQNLSIVRNGLDVIVNLATDGAGAIISTPAQIVAALAGTEAAEIVSAVGAGGAAVAAVASQSFDNAADDPRGIHRQSALSVKREGLHVQVLLATNPTSAAITTTAVEVSQAIANHGEASELITCTDDAAQAGVVTALAPRTFGGAISGAVGTIQDICDGLRDTLNAMLPVQSVVATTQGGGAAAQLRLLAELAGYHFTFSYGCDEAALGNCFTVAADNDSIACDVNKAARGVTILTQTMENTGTTNLTNGYPASSVMSVLREGRIRVKSEDAPTTAQSVYVRLADTANTGEPIGSFRSTAAQDCVKLDSRIVRWHRTYNQNIAALFVACD